MPLAAQIVRLTPEGPLIDFLDPETTRPNTPEEHVRQVYARKLHYEYGYPKEVMAFGAPITMGSGTKFADIVIYESKRAAQRKDQTEIRIIVETKAPEIRTGEAQLKSYISASSAEGGVWINEKDAPRYWRRDGRHIKEWPNIPRFGEEWDAIGKHKKAHLHQPHNLVETFKRCHNALHKVGIDSEDLAMDMVRIILAKYRDELNPGETCEFRCTALELQANEGRRRVAERIKALFVQVRDDNRDVFGEHEVITAGEREIATVVAELQDFRFLPDALSGELYDVVGAAYEVYVGSHLKGDRGQYFTHRLVVNLLVKIIDPNEHDIVLDVAMGSGGFLISTMRRVTQKIMASTRPAHLKQSAIQQFYRRIFGIDKSPKLVKVARTNMILASDGHAGLIHGDTLEPPERLPGAFLQKSGPGLPTVILTNPPFGATAEHKITAEKDPQILEQFDLGKRWKRNDDGDLYPTDALAGDGVPPEYLFVERCIKWVKPGGKIGIVLPRGVLDNDRALPTRTLIFRETRVLAVINCHDDTFKPHTDAKCALLALERKPAPTDRGPDYPIFMAISQGIGHDGLGFPIYKTDAKGDPILVNGEMVLDEDTGTVGEAWDLVNAGQPSPSPWCFQITRKDIDPVKLKLNPVRYLPALRATRQRVLDLGEREGWAAERLGQIAYVFGGMRLKRTHAYVPKAAPGTFRFFTGNAVTQTRGENIKHIDPAKLKPDQLKTLHKMILRRGMILITRSGTVGRVVYATAYHDGAVGTEDVIRVVIENEALRGYVYQFLLSRFGQDQLRRNIYGAIVDHIEPDHVKDVQVPVPLDAAVLNGAGLPVIRGILMQEFAFNEMQESKGALADALEETAEEDASDAATARAILAGIGADPARLVSGEALKAELDGLLA